MTLAEWTAFLYGLLVGLAIGVWAAWFGIPWLLDHWVSTIRHTQHRAVRIVRTRRRGR